MSVRVIHGATAFTLSRSTEMMMMMLMLMMMMMKIMMMMVMMMNWWKGHGQLESDHA